jgi:hypothetical protein
MAKAFIIGRRCAELFHQGADNNPRPRWNAPSAALPEADRRSWSMAEWAGQWQQTRRYLPKHWAPGVPEGTALHLHHGWPAEHQCKHPTFRKKHPIFRKGANLKKLELDVGAAGNVIALGDIIGL